MEKDINETSVFWAYAKDFTIGCSRMDFLKIFENVEINSERGNKLISIIKHLVSVGLIKPIPDYVDLRCNITEMGKKRLCII